MKQVTLPVIRYEAEDGMVFDWKEPRYHEEEQEDGSKIQVQDHLYAKILYIGSHDSIDNYVEVPEPNQE